MLTSECAVNGCPNDRRYPRKPKFKMFGFPVNNEALLQQWLAVCRTDEIDVHLARVCSDHFAATDFDPELQGQEVYRTTRLRPTAVPTLNFPERLSMFVCVCLGINF